MFSYLAEIFVVFRITGSLALVAFVPGLALSFWLFPRGRLELPERLLVAITASVAVSTIVGFALIRFAGGLHPISFAVGTVALTTLFGLGATLRSRRDSERQVGQIMSGSNQGEYRHRRRRRYLMAALLLLPAVMIATAGAALLRKEPSLSLTEFYISPQYLPEIMEGQGRATLPDFAVDIANREGRSMTYRIEIWADGARMLDQLMGIQIPSDATTRVPIPGAMSGTEDAAFVELRLFSEAGPVPLAELRLWVEPGRDKAE